MKNTIDYGDLTEWNGCFYDEDELFSGIAIEEEKGQLKALRINSASHIIKSKDWTEDGTLTKDYKMTKNDPNYQRFQERKSVLLEQNKSKSSG